MSDIDLAKIVADDAAQRSAAEQVAAPAETLEVEDTAEATTAPADEAAEEQPTEAEGDEPERPKKSGGGFQKRISELTREKHEALRRVEAAEDRERRLLALIETNRGGQAPQSDDDTEPTSDRFNRYEDFVAARAEWRAEQKVKATLGAYQQQVGAKDQENNRLERARNFAAEAKQQGKAIQGFDAALQRVQAEDFPMTPAMGEYLLDAENKAAVVKYLTDDEDAAFRISRLQPIAQVKELAKLDARFSAKPKPKTSSAPPPPATVSGGAAAPQTIERMDHKGVLDWVRAMDQRR